MKSLLKARKEPQLEVQEAFERGNFKGAGREKGLTWQEMNLRERLRRTTCWRDETIIDEKGASAWRSCGSLRLEKDPEFWDTGALFAYPETGYEAPEARTLESFARGVQFRGQETRTSKRVIYVKSKNFKAQKI